MRFYLDTSIWLDFFEYRDEPNLPKGEWAHKLIKKIIKENAKIIYSDHVISEMEEVGYSTYELDEMFSLLKQILLFVETTKKQIGKAKDLAIKRKIPKGDALHALIARDNKAIMVTLDRHFRSIQDITKSRNPQDLLKL